MARKRLRVSRYEYIAFFQEKGSQGSCLNDCGVLFILTNLTIMSTPDTPHPNYTYNRRIQALEIRLDFIYLVDILDFELL